MQVLHVLELLHPKLMTLLKLKESIKYIEAVNELAATPEDKALLSPDLLEVLENGDELKSKHKDNEVRPSFHPLRPSSPRPQHPLLNINAVV